ncbi:membrane protein [Stenotrophomonas terrae]|uniref:Membrane protein n=1 Tax=Stenotrophomonas terrae TaxID=405446 RepID=A0A0R0C863_9GAMM|nr:DUF3025 domain-containing protein [Stenotrophomonas terrae]KRG61523.1 membrane protein [Stenotrophomonas terrae]
MTCAPAADDAGSGRRRFLAPAREQVAHQCFEQPIFGGFADYVELLQGADWPDIATLNAQLAVQGKQFVIQDEALLGDGLHYEQRIAQGRIATRAQNWHDLFNALVWARYPAIKFALNAQQCLHIAAMGTTQRNSAQAALTQFDETGVIVRVRDAALLSAWDRHDWATLFDPRAWQQGDIAICALIGHALLEQALLPGRLLVGKSIVVLGEDDAACVARVAAAIAEAQLLAEPSELRPLPLAGIPGWHASQDAAFYQLRDYFRPLREGRVYPSALSLRS